MQGPDDVSATQAGKWLFGMIIAVAAVLVAVDTIRGKLDKTMRAMIKRYMLEVGGPGQKITEEDVSRWNRGHKMALDASRDVRRLSGDADGTGGGE